MLALVVALAATGVWLAVRGGGADTNARFTALLPRDTLAVLHVPDFNQLREQWRETDIYRLWREPAVQEFLQKPLARVPQSGGFEERMAQLERLGIRDGFAALTSWTNQAPTFVAGFRFKASKTDAEKAIGEWLDPARQDAPAAQPETVQHGRHRLTVVRRGETTLATVYDRDWFFAANNVAALTALLDRAGSKTSDTAATLAADAAFEAASKRMPANYAVRGYARLDEFFARMAARLPPDEENARGSAALRQIRSVSVATVFDNGKIRDVLFVAMPKSAEQAELTRGSLALATGETFLYLATILNLPAEFGGTKSMPPMAGAGVASGLQGFASRLGASGITLEDWNTAFGSELGVIGEWPANARFPALLATLPVRDAAKADQIASVLTDSTNEGSRWAVAERDGIRYYSQPPHNPLVPISPTLGLGRERAVLGLDAGSVGAAMSRATAQMDSQLATSDRFKAAEAAVGTPRQSFTYLDTAQLYTKLDAAVRPMLIMGAAFVPSIAQTVDLNKVPPAEVVTRHLSPIVVSQRYEDEGYLTESVGPVSIYHAAVAIAAASGAGATWYRANVSPGSAASVAPPQTDSATPSPSPEETP